MTSQQSLKSVAGLFAASYKPYAFGAFGTPGMREVADADSSGRLIRYRAGGTVAEGADILKVLGVDSRHRDFCGRTCVIPRGSVFVQHLCTTPGAEAEVAPELIRIIKERTAGVRTWLELHEENIALREQFEVRHGFAHVLTKIMASSDIRGLYVHPPGRNGLPPLPRHEIATLRCLDSKFLSAEELTAVRDELSRYTGAGNVWGQHYSHYNKRRSWTAFAVRGYEPEDATFIAKPAEMSKAWKAAHPKLLTAGCVDTAAAAYFTRTLEVLKRLPRDKERVRFMRLAPRNGELGRHADIKIGRAHV